MVNGRSVEVTNEQYEANRDVLKFVRNIPADKPKAAAKPKKAKAKK
jgi:hypothetical protein